MAEVLLESGKIGPRISDRATQHVRPDRRRIVTCQRIGADQVYALGRQCAGCLRAPDELDGSDFADIARVDLTIDGADEIDARCFAIKGAGGAMLREKIVAASSARMIVIADGSKQVDRIGAAKLPVEVLPFARGYVERVLAELGVAPVMRDKYRTDQGNLVIDCHFATLEDPRATAALLAAIPGILGHGLFLDEVDAAYIATNGVVTRLERAGASA